MRWWKRTHHMRMCGCSEMIVYADNAEGVLYPMMC